MTGQPFESDDNESRRRDRALSGTVQAYRDYESSGYGDRWTDRSPGERLIVAERNRWLLRAFAGVSGTILDLGCGDGNLAEVLDRGGRRPARFVGMDLIEERVALARERVPWGEFVAGSADRVPLPEGSAEAVAALLLLSSVPDSFLLRAILAEVTRVTQPGGRFVVYDLRYPSPRNRKVHPLDLRQLSERLPGWSIRTETLTLLPPLARGPLGATARRYRAFSSIPFLRSHLGIVATAPA